MVLILDSSAIFAMENLPDDECVCPQGVIDELTRYKDIRHTLWGDSLKVLGVSSNSIEIVRIEAEKSGDLGRLSPVDITVIALGYELKGIVLSDDFSILNVCSIMKIENKPVATKGIKKIERWNYQCAGCKKWFRKKPKECPVCGSSLRAYKR
ncbi:MAG: nucleic acid-binding protein [archaeon]|nr:nucleic acid-binding protein [archaeon]